MPGWFFARKFGSGNGANTGGKYSFIGLFVEKKHFKRILTVLFSGPTFCAKTPKVGGCPAGPGQPGARYDRN